MPVRDLEAGTPVSAPGEGTQVEVSTVTDEDLSKALYGIKFCIHVLIDF